MELLLIFCYGVLSSSTETLTDTRKHGFFFLDRLFVFPPVHFWDLMISSTTYGTFIFEFLWPSRGLIDETHGWHNFFFVGKLDRVYYLKLRKRLKKDIFFSNKTNGNKRLVPSVADTTDLTLTDFIHWQWRGTRRNKRRFYWGAKPNLTCDLTFLYSRYLLIIERTTTPFTTHQTRPKRIEFLILFLTYQPVLHFDFCCFLTLTNDNLSIIDWSGLCF